VVQETAKNTIDAVEAFSTMITSYAIASGSKWPLVTVPDFTSQSIRLAHLTKALQVNYAPIVFENDIPAYNAYSAANLQPYYQEYIDVTGLQHSVEAMINLTVPFVARVPESEGVFSVVPVEGPGPFLVGWQMSGLMDAGYPFVNYNFLGDPRINKTFWTDYTTNMPSLEFLTRYTFNEEGEVVDLALESQLMQPIFETIYNGKASRKELKMVGVVLLAFQWERYFQSILAEDVAGIVLVLSSACSSDVFTFEINGGDVLPLGPGDLHDKKYDDMLFSTPFANFEVDPATLVDSERCLSELTMSIYPSKTFEESFYTWNSVIFAGGVVAIFAFTTVVFSVYDMSVRRRQRIVMDRIIRQDKIVSNLFPAAIRDRMYAGNDDAGKTPEGLELDDDLDSPDIFGAAPMAELYPDVTVIFADISGFTAWSSAREPPQYVTCHCSHV
jgi:hypothetical protein